MATNQKFHLQPLAAVRKPPMIGPTQGPTANSCQYLLHKNGRLYLLGPIIQTTMAVPRCSLLIKSAIVPPPSTIGAPPKQPIKNRKTTNWPILVDTAAAMLKMTNKALQLWYNGKRPYISDIGAITTTCQ